MQGGAKLYARYAAVVQSSGTGKSRLMDEAATTMFSIPINLRKASARGVCLTSVMTLLLNNIFLSLLGYPPRDPDARAILIDNMNDKPQVDVLSWHCAFLTSLFDHALQTVQSIDAEIQQYGISQEGLPTLAAKFRALMSHGMRFNKHGGFRENFYKKVHLRTHELLHSRTTKTDRPDSPIKNIIFEGRYTPFVLL
jgi:hypothetical protein